MIDIRPKTIICDIDGTLILHNKPNVVASSSYVPELLEGTIDKINEWERNGYNIILLTGRKESMRKVTEKQLTQLGIYYDQLIMGIGGGPRYLINDCKPDKTQSAFAINIERNKGIKNINI
jgi:ribonucleotide monophosphatase NagD (HAD superfamily)